jgi:hypothetical protein
MKQQTIKILHILGLFLLTISTLIVGRRSAAQPPDTVRFAVLGDFGTGGENAAAVANMVKSWNPDFIVTTGDNNYPDGTASTIDHNIGQYFHEYIYPYHGTYGNGADQNRFFPTLGNHDWHTLNAQPYLDYFTLPGNERYYEVRQGPVQLFMLDSDPNEPDGITATSIQSDWLQAQLAESDAPWKLVFEHHPPFSSSQHGSTQDLQWPYKDWGVTAVISGHEHSYERIVIDGFPYFVNGLGGTKNHYDFQTPVQGSVVRYNQNNGAMLVEATNDSITFQFFSIDDSHTAIDTYTISSDTIAPTSTPLVADVSQDLVLTPEADARVEEADPDVNFGRHTTLRVDGGSDPGIESYIQFTVTGVTQPIQTATLRLFTSTDKADNLSVYTTSDTWIESQDNGITWTTRPSRDPDLVGTIPSASANEWIDLDVTPVVTGNGTYSFVVATDSTDGLTFSSREGDNPPQLVLTFR